ncbi:EAL domain-containing protein [Yoonia sp. F2084L]|uniref:putative bifunctional diguanylate cyclase/phosphodiesterase n=1 Tax=Yoonia sp. F2084L TaxID=2926419 RepID=UPI001FF26966|nr:EAL domain-containing protein [Yoonia sp. F2084L]MCK0095422.1 EAL domain-containing protein [Yoonia sp. F2084L]
MRQTQIDHFLHQTQIAGHISGRDVPKRVASALLMVGICHIAGFGLEGVILGFCVIVLEIIAYPLNARASQFKKRLSLPMAIAVFGVNWAAMFPFLGFAVVLSYSDTVPFVLISYLWAFGIYVHVSNTFGLLPVYNWSQMTVAFGTIFLMLWNVSQNPAFEGQSHYWMLTAILTAVYIVNTFDTMNLQKDTHQALERARQEANARLADLERLSRSDSLTGLMNRRAFDEVVQSMMHQHANKQGVTVFLIDLDGFKPINDSYGHVAGDAVLCAIAERLEKLTDRGDRVARVGGDEFAVLSSSITSVKAAQKLAEQIIATLSAAVPFEQKQLDVGISIGIARQGPDANTPPELLSGADQAMYLAKQDPDVHVKIYDKNAFPVRPTLKDREMLIRAMETGQIVPHYQPKVRIDTGQLVGFEALSRWHHPTRGILPPSQFLPMINELALQGAFMTHTARHVMDDLAQMVDDGLDPGQVSINMSEVTLATLVGRKELFAVIERYPALRRYLTFEITEDIFIARSSDVIRRSIALFRQAGVRISLDDFGTGYASLQHLKELEFDELKLDTGFVRDLGIDPTAKVLIEGLVTISKGLNVDLIAEGVENLKQRDMLRDMGCLHVQGYYYGGAVPFEEAYLRLTAEGRRLSGIDDFSQPQDQRAAV